MDQNVLFSDYCFSSHCSALQIARTEMVILSSILCLIVAVTSIWGEESSAPAHGCVCVCDCEKLKIENNLLKHLILQRQEPSLQLLSSFEENDDQNGIESESSPPSWTESLIISTYKTLVTSLAVTEIPIWWRNRQVNGRPSQPSNISHPILAVQGVTQGYLIIF